MIEGILRTGNYLIAYEGDHCMFISEEDFEYKEDLYGYSLKEAQLILACINRPFDRRIMRSRCHRLQLIRGKRPPTRSR